MTCISLYIWGIIAIFVLILVTLAVIAIYSGLFSSFQVGAGEPPLNFRHKFVVAYKFDKGPQKVGNLFSETAAYAPGLKCFGVYYDYPNEVHSDSRRFIIGAILAEGDEQPDKTLEDFLKTKEYKIHHFPAMTSCVRTTFPYTTPLSIYLAVRRVCPALAAYIRDRRLCAHPLMEVYDGDKIHFLVPLAKQDEFYVPEVTEPDAVDDSMTEFSSESGVTDGSSFGRNDGSFFDGDDDEPKPKNFTEEMPPKAEAEEETSLDAAVPADGASENIPSTPDAGNGHDSGSEHSTGTGSSFEEVTIDLDELKSTPVMEERSLVPPENEAKDNLKQPTEVEERDD